MRSIRDGASALALLDWHTITSIPPSELQRAGAIAERMRGAGFDQNKCQLVVKALFLTSSSSMSEREVERHFELAFDVWDEHHRGVLSLAEFERDLHLMFDDTFSAEEQQTVVRRVSAQVRSHGLPA